MAKSLKAAAKNFGGQGRWDEPIKDQLFPIPAKPALVRLYNHIVTVRSHWVEFFSEKKKATTGYAELCLNWDAENEQEIDGGCPMCAEGMKYTEHHYAYLINRVMQKKTKQTTVHPVRLTNKLATSIVKLSEYVYPGEDDAPDATDPEGGFDIFISTEQKNSKTDYVAAHTTNITPLTKAEKEAFEAYVAENDVGVLAKPRPRAEVEQKLRKFKVLEGGASDNGGERGQRPQRNYTEYDSEQVPEGEPEPEPTPPPRTAKPAAKPAASAAKPQAKPAPKRQASVTGGDDEEGDATPQGARGGLPWDSEDENMTSSYATADEDDAPESEEE